MKQFIVYSKIEDDFYIIVDAHTGQTGEFQWYLVDDPNETKKEILKRQIYASITLSSAQIQKAYEGKWLCCHCKVDGDVYNEGCLYLTDSLMDIIRENQFENIVCYNENGKICGNQYMKMEEKKCTYTEQEVEKILNRATDALSNLSVPKLVDYAERPVFNGRDTWYGWREYLLTGNIENEYAKQAIEKMEAFIKEK